MTKMVMGYRCGENVTMPSKDLSSVKERISNHFAFIGITEVHPKFKIMLLCCEDFSSFFGQSAGMGCIYLLVSSNAWGQSKRSWIRELPRRKNKAWQGTWSGHLQPLSFHVVLYMRGQLLSNTLMKITVELEGSRNYISIKLKVRRLSSEWNERFSRRKHISDGFADVSLKYG